MIPALAERDPTAAYLFYDCQTDDSRLVLTILGEAERYGAVMLNGAEVTEVLERDGRAGGVAFTEAGSGERIEVEAANVVNATGVWADRLRPEETVDEEDVPRISPSRGTHVLIERERLADAARRPASSQRARTAAIFALPWYGRTLIGTTDNDYDGDIDHVAPAADDIDYLLEAINSFFGTSLADRRHQRRLRRGATADRDRRPAQVGRHLAQGGALRDLVRDADDHRRQAHDLAADGEADGRPTGRARGSRGALLDRRDPARDGGRPEGPRGAGGGRGGTVRQLAFRYGHAARHVLALVRERPELGEPIVDGRPDLLAEAVIAARLEQARSVADVILRRTRLGLVAASQLRGADSGARRGGGDGRGAGLADEGRVGDEAERWLGDAAAEGIDPAAG